MESIPGPKIPAWAELGPAQPQLVHSIDTFPPYALFPNHEYLRQYVPCEGCQLIMNHASFLFLIPLLPSSVSASSQPQLGAELAISTNFSDDNHLE